MKVACTSETVYQSAISESNLGAPQSRLYLIEGEKR